MTPSEGLSSSLKFLNPQAERTASVPGFPHLWSSGARILGNFFCTGLSAGPGTQMGTHSGPALEGSQ